MELKDIIKTNTATYKRFVIFLVSDKRDYNTIIASDNHSIIMHIIDFLATENVYIIVDHNGLVVYKMFDVRQHIIECKFSDATITTKFIAGIIIAFNYLENPF